MSSASLRDGLVGRAGGHHEDLATHRVRRVGGPRQQPAGYVVEGVGQLAEDRCGVLRAGPGEQRAGSMAAQRAGDQPDLFGRLAPAVHRLRIASAGSSVEIEVGEGGQRLVGFPGLRHGSASRCAGHRCLLLFAQALIAISVTISRSDRIVTDGGRERGRAVCHYPPGTGQAKAIHFSEDLGGEARQHLQRSVRRPVQLNLKSVT